MLELAVETDREAVNWLACQVHAMHVGWLPETYEMPPEMYPKERFQKAIAERSLYVARLHGAVVGYMNLMIRNFDGLGLKKRKVLRIDEIAVEESLRGQGVGTEMMEDVRALAKTLGCTSLQLGVYPQNAAAVAFYAYIIPFLISTGVGAVIAGILVFSLQRSGVLRSMQSSLS